MLAVLQEHGADGAAAEVATPFRLNPGLIIWTWIVFLVLFFMLRRFAWPAILRLAEERERTIHRQLAEAEKMHAEAQAALEEHRKLLAGAKDEAARLIGQARTVAEKERETLLERTRQEQEHMLDRARREIEAERDRAIVELRREAVDLSLAAASRLVENNLDTDAHRKLVVEYLDAMGQAS